MLLSGFWFLVFGFWLLVFGFWFLVLVIWVFVCLLLGSCGVIAIRFNQNVVDESRIWIILGMVSSWMVLVTASMLTISFLEPNLSLTDVSSVSISLLGNTGPGLGSFGPADAAST